MSQAIDKPISTPWDSLDYFMVVIERELAKGCEADRGVVEDYCSKFKVLTSRISFWGCPSWKIKEEFFGRWDRLREQVEALELSARRSAYREEQLCLSI